MSSVSKYSKLIDFILANIRDVKKLLKWTAFATAVIVWFRYNKIWAKKHDNIYTFPNQHPLVGHLFKMHSNLENINDYMYTLHKQANFPSCASFSVKLPFLFGTYNSVQITDPALVKFIFHQQFSSFKKGVRVKEELEELLGDGIFTSDPPEWKMHRKVASRMFSMRNLKDFMFECTVSHTKNVINKINSLDQSNAEYIDIYNMLARFTLDCFTDIAFGKSLESVSIYPKKHPFSEAFDNMVSAIVTRHTTPALIWKPIRMLPERFTFGNEYNIKRDIKVIDAFANKVLDSRQNIISKIRDESGDKYNDIISLFMKLSTETLSRAQLKHIAMNMIIAGRDTTRLLLSWFLYEMCKDTNKEIKLKIYREIDEYVHKNKVLDYEKVSDNLLYLESTFLETLRLNPVVPFLIRYAQKDVTLPNGNIIRKDNEVIIPTYVLGRNPKNYNNPLKFDPMRFYGKDKAPINVFDVYKYPFFNVKPRLCLGRHLALMESKVFIFYFFQQYMFERDPSQEIKIQYGIVLNMVDGLRLKLTKRE